MKKPRILIVGGILSCTVVAILLYALSLEYLPTPDFDFPLVDEHNTRKFRSASTQDPYVFFVEESEYLISSSDFTNETELEDYIDKRITAQGWTANVTLLSPVSEFCSRLEGLDAEETAVYVNNQFIEQGAVNRWAAPHLCLAVKHNAGDQQYEILVATFKPTFISALTD